MINIVHFRSQQSRTFFAPNWHFVMGEAKLDGLDFKQIADYILVKEKEIVAEFPFEGIKSIDAYTGLGPDSLTSRWRHFNVLSWDHPEIQKMKEGIHKTYLEFLASFNAPRPNVWVQCWANVLRSGQEIGAHCHADGPWSYLGGHISVQCKGTQTCYMTTLDQINNPKIYRSDNEVGKITLFQQCIPHFTTPHHDEHERITIAFDFILEDSAAFKRMKENKQLGTYIPFDVTNETGKNDNDN